MKRPRIVAAILALLVLAQRWRGRQTVKYRRNQHGRKRRRREARRAWRIARARGDRRSARSLVTP